MIITKQYIMDNRTKAGSWTKSQLMAIGAGWPAKKGWLGRLVGTGLSEDKAEIFERKITAKSTVSVIDKACKVLTKNISELSDEKFKRLMAAMNTDLERRILRGMD